MKSHKILVELFVDPKFWAIIPAININIHSGSCELEWLCFGMYVDFVSLNKSDHLEINPLDNNWLE